MREFPLEIIAPSSEAGARELLPPLRLALRGSGPAVAPLPMELAARARASTAVASDLPLGLEVAAVIVTSGSTGDPKAALLSAAALLASAEATHDRLGGPGQWLLALPMTHIAGFQILVRSVLAGCPPVAMDLDAGFTPEGFVDAASRLDSAGLDSAGLDSAGSDSSVDLESVAARPRRRYTSLVATQLRRLLDAERATETLASFDAVLVGGGTVPQVIADRARAAGVRLVVTYGMTETCGGCVYDGVPLTGVKVSLDAADRIRIAGPVLFDGYRTRAEESLADGWFRTSDVGKWTPDGRLEVLGRFDDVIVTGGEKVAPAAVTDVLMTHPGVVDAVVIGVPHSEWGREVAAVIVPHPDVTIDVDEARTYVATRLGRRSAPRRLLQVERLPLLASGKVDRTAVIELVKAEISESDAGDKQR